MRNRPHALRQSPHHGRLSLPDASSVLGAYRRREPSQLLTYWFPTSKSPKRKRHVEIQILPLLDRRVSHPLSPARFLHRLCRHIYASDAVTAADYQVQSWFAESVLFAKVLSFPSCGAHTSHPFTKEIFIDVLAHFAWLQVANHTLNSGDPVRSKLTLSFHPGGLYALFLARKGNITDSALATYLLGPEDAVSYIEF